MPRLSRTAKYADLRAQLANDKEETIQSNDLSSYQDRLNNVQDTLSFSTQEVKQETNNEKNNEYTWKPFEGDSFSQAVEPIKPWEKEETSTFEEVKVEEPVQNEAPVFEQPVQEEPKQETSSYFDSFMNEPVKEETKTTDYSSYFENIEQPVQEKQTIEEIYSDVFEDVKDNSGEIVNIKERDTYLNQTFSDVNAYNQINNQPTINTIVDDSVNAVRHPEDAPETTVKFEEPVQEEPVDNTYAWTPFVQETPAEQEALDADKVEEEPQIDDEEFSNTVSMEITKIMDEIANVPEEVETPAPVVEEKVEEPVIQETIQINETLAEEKPEEVVEIKNISEMKEEPAKDTMSSTIPFIVAAEDEAVVDEDEEEDGSNTVLNVILIVLIVVLVAVLGLIIFYILKTKGIF